MAAASGTYSALAAAALARALIADGDVAEGRYREAIELLVGTRMASHLARARLCYGEWLRRSQRRAEASTQLRAAFDAFSAMGANAFADRARRELEATGDKVRTLPRGARRRTDASRASNRPARADTAHQPRDRRRTVPERTHRGMAPAQHLHQARHQLTPRTRRRPHPPRSPTRRGHARPITRLPSCISGFWHAAGCRHSGVELGCAPGRAATEMSAGSSASGRGDWWREPLAILFDHDFRERGFQAASGCTASKLSTLVLRVAAPAGIRSEMDGRLQWMDSAYRSVAGVTIRGV